MNTSLSEFKREYFEKKWRLKCNVPPPRKNASQPLDRKLGGS